MNKKVKVAIKESTYERLKSTPKLDSSKKFVDTAVNQVLDLLEGKPNALGRVRIIYRF